MSQSALLPNRFLFRYSLPVQYERRLPKTGKKLLDLSADFALPDFGDLEQLRPFGSLRMAWHEKGIGISVAVEGKSQPVNCDPFSPEKSDGLRIFIDTRNTQNIHRASRYCHQFFLMPARAGSAKADPCALQEPILRAREEAPRANVVSIRLAASISKTGYLLEAWFPSSVLYGYDPEAQSKLGFYYALRDSELGEQFLSVGQDFPFSIDPSLWSTLELVKTA